LAKTKPAGSKRFKDMTQQERVAAIRTHLSELSAQTQLPASVRDAWKNKILKKAARWDITLAEFADDSQGGHLVTDKDGKKHLPTTKAGKPDHGLMGAAHAALHGGFRGNKYEGPDKGKAIDKLKALYKSEDMDWPGESDKSGEFSVKMEPQFFQLSEPTVDRFNRQAYRIPIAITGDWTKGKPFSITDSTLEALKGNLEKRKNGELTMDFNHASEDPNVEPDRGISAGWLTDPEIEHVNDRSVLTVLYAPTPKAQEHIEKQEYRYVSPAIDYTSKDKETGESQGPTLTSAALVNRPFLEELPPLTLREVYWRPGAVLLTELTGGKPMTKLEQIDAMRVQVQKLLDENKVEDAKVILSDVLKMEDEVMTFADTAPRLRVRKMKDKFAVFGHGDGKSVGYVTAADMNACMSGDKKDDDEDDDEDGKKMREFMKSNSLKFSDVAVLIDKGKTAVIGEQAGKGRKLLLSEAFRNGVFDHALAAACCNAHREIVPADILAAQRADKILDSAVRAGKMTPFLRVQFAEEVVADPEKWEKKILPNMVSQFNVDRGLGNPQGEQPTANDQIKVLVETRRKENPKESYSDALRVVLSEHRDLAEARSCEKNGNRNVMTE
jgi:hypothetical protein